MTEWAAYYPLLAGLLFWVGAAGQIHSIVSLKSAHAVSVLQWSLASAILFGYCGFYWLYLRPGRARVVGILVSAISGTLYAVIVGLTLYY